VAEFAEVLTENLSPERGVIGERTLEEALSALNELGERTRAMFYLYRFENLKDREIAQIYGISASSATNSRSSRRNCSSCRRWPRRDRECLPQFTH